MAHVTVTIAGRAYRMACGDGEEERLEELARQVDAKIAELKGAFGEIGDQRITVMAAVTFADDLAEAKRRIAALESERQTLAEARTVDEAAHDEWMNSVAQAIARTATRIEEIAQGRAVEARGDGEPLPA